MASSAGAGTTAPPRGPKGRLFFGSLGDLRRDQLGFYVRCAREYGDVVPVRLGPTQGVLVYHPDAIEEALVARSRDFMKSQGVRILRALLGDGLLLSEGDFWLRQRRLVQPAFHRQRIAAYGEVMATYAAERAARWTADAVVDLHEEMMSLTQAIVAKTLFDADVSDDSHRIAGAARVVAEFFGDRLASLRQLLPVWLPTPSNIRMHLAVRKLDAVVFRMIATRRQHPADRGDLLSILLQAQDADDGSTMTDRQVRDEVMTLFLAGHETTAVALSWAWFLLAQHPEADARLAAELRTVLGGRAPAVSDLPALRYADMVITESMRLYPAAYALARQAVRPTEVGEHALAPGEVLIAPTWAVQRDARWFADPEAFRPERWEGDLARRLPRFAYFPFGGGPRQCIGNAFAQMEAVLILAAIAQRFRLELVPGQRIRPTPYVTLRPEPGIRMRLAPR